MKRKQPEDRPVQPVGHLLPNEFTFIQNRADCPHVCCVCLRVGKAYAYENAGGASRPERSSVYCKRCYLGRINTRLPFTETEINQCRDILSKSWMSIRHRNDWVKESSTFVLGCWECGIDLQRADPRLWPKPVHEGIPRPLAEHPKDRLFCLKCMRKYMIGTIFCCMCKRVQEKGKVKLFSPSGARLCTECVASVVQAHAKDLHLLYAQKAVVRCIQTPGEYEGFVAPPLGSESSDSEGSHS